MTPVHRPGAPHDDAPHAVDVVTLGEVMGLLLAPPGTALDQATSFTVSAAGAEFNTAVGLARLGLSVALLTCVGDDPPGRALARHIRAEGLDPRGVRVRPGLPTGLLMRDAHGHREVTVAYRRSGSAATTLALTHEDAALVAACRLLHLTGITPALSPAAYDAVDAALAAAGPGTLVSFDPNLRRSLPQDRVQLRELAAAADVVLTGAGEATWLTGSNSVDQAVADLLDGRPRLVVIKDGPRGSWATDGVTTWRQPPLPGPVLDPVGAGDAYNAGFLATWLRGGPVPDGLADAAYVASCCLATPGDAEGLPGATEVARARSSTGEVLR